MAVTEPFKATKAPQKFVVGGYGNEEDDTVVGDLPAEDAAPELTEQDDGGLLVDFGGDAETPEDAAQEFGSNLAVFLSMEERREIANTYLELIEQDITDRQARDKKLEDALKRTGFGKDAPGGADFEGASRVSHPILGEASIDFSARERKELLPANGPVKSFIDGEAQPQKLAIAKRKTAYMNKQLIFKSKSFRVEMAKMLSQLPLGGSQYVKATWNAKRKCPDFEFVPIERMFLPSAATGFQTAHRRTIRDKITEVTVQQRIDSGLYHFEKDVKSNVSLPNEDRVQIVKNQIQGVQETASINQDGLRTVYECYALDDFSDVDDLCEGACPYILHFDKDTNELVGMYRNWAETDTTHEEIDWVVDFGFIQWDGPYDLGLPHLIGGLAVSMTGSLRALLDSAHIQNSPTSIALSQQRVSGQTIPIVPGQINRLQVGAAVDDIRKAAMPLPISGPSPVLFQLLGWLTEAGRGVVRTAMDDTKDSDPATPVGTQLARTEQGLAVFSDIHAGLHYSMMRLLMIVARLDGENLEEEIKDPRTGEVLALRSDFQYNDDIIPVSDPRIFTELQRYQQSQFMMQLAGQFPNDFNMKALLRCVLDTANIKVGREAFKEDPEPIPLTPIEENLRMSKGQPVEPMPDQDQLLYIHTIKSLMASPYWGMNPVTAPVYLPLALANLSKRLVYWFVNSMNKNATQMTGQPVDMSNSIAIQQAHGPQGMDMAASGSATMADMITQEAANVFPDLLQVMQAAQDLLKSLAPKDPSQVIAQAEIERQRIRDEKNNDARLKEIQVDEQRVAVEGQHGMAKVNETRKTSEDRILMNEQDNSTALELEQMNIDAGKNVHIRNTRLPGN